MRILQKLNQAFYEKIEAIIEALLDRVRNFQQRLQAWIVSVGANLS